MHFSRGQYLKTKYWVIFTQEKCVIDSHCSNFILYFITPLRIMYLSFITYRNGDSNHSEDFSNYFFATKSPLTETETFQSFLQIRNMALPLLKLAVGSFTMESCKNAPDNFAISACPPIFPHVTTRKPLNGFSWNLVLGRYTKMCRRINILDKIEQYVTRLKRYNPYRKTQSFHVRSLHLCILNARS
jgi:hypothetical protein